MLKSIKLKPATKLSTWRIYRIEYILTQASPIMSIDINVPIRSALVLETNHFVSVVSLV